MSEPNKSSVDWMREQLRVQVDALPGTGLSPEALESEAVEMRGTACELTADLADRGAMLALAYEREARVAAVLRDAIGDAVLPSVVAKIQAALEILDANVELDG